jgi:hypothetical protein
LLPSVSEAIFSVASCPHVHEDAIFAKPYFRLQNATPTQNKQKASLSFLAQKKIKMDQDSPKPKNKNGPTTQKPLTLNVGVARVRTGDLQCVRLT